MAKQFLTIPKNGKVGDSNYLKSTILSEILSQGWYRGQMNDVQTKLFGLTRVRGKLVYGNKLANISDYARPTDASVKGKQVNKFLDLLGFTDRQKLELYNNGRQSGVDSIGFDWQGELTYSASELGLVYDNILTILSNVEFIKITHKDGTGVAKPMVDNAGSYAKDLIVDRINYPSSYTEDGQEISTFPGYDSTSTGELTTRSQWSISTIELVEFGGAIKTDVDGIVLDALIALIGTSGDKFVDLQSYSQVGTWNFKGNWIDSVEDSESTYTVKRSSDFVGKIVEDIYKIKTTSNFAEDEFYKYDIVKEYKYTEFDGEVRINNPRGYDAIWSLLYQLGFNGIADLGNSFITEYPSSNWWLDGSGEESYFNKKGKRYLLVDAIKKYNFDNTIFYMSKFAHFNVNYAKRKGGFLGIGGFVGDLLGGIVNAVVSVISLVGGVAYYIPSIRLTTQFVMWIFTGEWTNDRDKFKMAFTKIVLIIIAILIIWFSGGTATEKAIQFVIAALSGLYSLYSLNSDFEKLDQAREMQAIQEARRQVSDEQVEDVSKVLDSDDNYDADDEMFNGMFDDYDDMDRMYANPFDGQFDINLDIKIK